MAVAKLERLMTLMATLLHTSRPLTANEIHDRIDLYPRDAVAFRRAFERDKDELRARGIPLTVTASPEVDPPIDGYRIRPEDYELDDPGLEADELAAVATAASLIRLEGTEAGEALRKLGGLTAQGLPSSGPTAAIPTSPNVAKLAEAAASRSVVEFTYNGRERVLEPWRVANRNGNWYVVGHDRTADDQRNFRTDRIEGAVTKVGDPGAYAVPIDADAAGRQPWEYGDSEETPEIDVQLLVDADRATIASRELGAPEVIEKRADGSVVFRVRVRNRGGFRSAVLALLDSAEVLSPPEMRDDMIEWLEALR